MYHKLHEIRHGEAPSALLSSRPSMDEREEMDDFKCPHVELGVAKEPLAVLPLKEMRCQECAHDKETWVCLKCFECHCGRFANRHMIAHAAATGHELCMNCSDMSIWCQKCRVTDVCPSCTSQACVWCYSYSVQRHKMSTLFQPGMCCPLRQCVA